MPINRATASDGGDTQEHCPLASEVIKELLYPVSVVQVRAYLEKTGWRLAANHFTWKDGWSLQPDLTNSSSWVYKKPDPEASNEDPQHFVVEVPGREEFRDHLGRLQFAIERIAAVEQTTFVSVICRILSVEQLVLLPEKQTSDKGVID